MSEHEWKVVAGKITINAWERIFNENIIQTSKDDGRNLVVISQCPDD